jgi:hypothetical protein
MSIKPVYKVGLAAMYQRSVDALRKRFCYGRVLAENRNAGFLTKHRLISGI